MPTVALSPSDVLTLGGASVVVNIVVAVTLKALSWTEAQRGRFAPLVALAEGIVIVGGFAISQHAPLDSAILTGALAGAVSMGLYDTKGSLVG